ncbi:MAG: NAD(P)/FAD-dependent oxidoreductase [Rhodobacteraceae bacterium]|nr:NAD(P)/FAD-dependent oxidoreductase [Paracoccaceae bacterium]
MQFDTVIIGAGAAGMMCAAFAGGRVLVVDHARAPGEKIRISGGGRCNFTNLGTTADQFLSANPHFAKSALARYTQWDFIDLVDRHGIAWHEKTLGQLFCDGSARQIVAMLVQEMGDAQLWLKTAVASVARDADGFALALDRDGTPVRVQARNLVVASGGKSIPKMGATGLAYDLARQFGIPVTRTRPALVPLTFADARFKPLAGVSVAARVAADGPAFDEGLLFTHRGLSGPAVLQASSYWREGSDITVALGPADGFFDALRAARSNQPKRQIATVLADHLPARLADHLAQGWDLGGRIADRSDAALRDIAERLAQWRLRPTGSEGYRTAEVTLGGIDTEALSARTMEARAVPGLYFIGEAVDVTGWLGGYNFQWAWSSGHAAGTAIAAG